MIDIQYVNSYESLRSPRFFMRAAERLIRGQGNHAGRQRMRADGTLRPPKPPRCLILATGEDVPSTNSITARLCIVNIQRGDVKLSRLSECQAEASAGMYALSMSGFIAWIAPQYEEIQTSLSEERATIRDRFVGKYPHARTPDIVANLLTGLRYFLRFAESIGVIDARQRNALWNRGVKTLGILADQQSEHLHDTDPVTRFPEMLASILSSGRGHLASPLGNVPDAPPSPETWGWVVREQHTDQLHRQQGYQARGEKIGWIDSDEIYLDPDSLYAALSELYRDQGKSYPITTQTLNRRLKEANYLCRTDADRTTYPMNLEGMRRRVLVLKASILTGKPGHKGAISRGERIELGFGTKSADIGKTFCKRGSVQSVVHFESKLWHWYDVILPFTTTPTSVLVTVSVAFMVDRESLRSWLRSSMTALEKLQG